MCQLELADAAIATKRSERGDAALSAQDRTRDDQCRSMCVAAAVAGPAMHLAIETTEASVVLELTVERLKEFDIETYGIDLTCQHFAVPVVRVIAPGPQLEPSEIVTARLRHTIA